MVYVPAQIAAHQRIVVNVVRVDPIWAVYYSVVVVVDACEVVPKVAFTSIVPIIDAL